MELFKDKTGLKVISVGFLLGMVSYLHGMPASSLSLSVQGNKVIVVYSGNQKTFECSALSFINENGLNSNLFIYDGSYTILNSEQNRPVIALNQSQLETWLQVDIRSIFSDIQSSNLKDNSFSVDISSLCLSSIQLYGVQEIGLIYSGLESFSSIHTNLANATRAGPIAG